jgi:hypothetical protein
MEDIYEYDEYELSTTWWRVQAFKLSRAVIPAFSLL